MRIHSCVVSTISLLLMGSASAWAQTVDDSWCFVTDEYVCISEQPPYNFGFDLSYQYSQQQLLAEIAVQYAQMGDLEKARRIAEALTIDSSRDAALSHIEDLPEQENGISLAEASPELVRELLAAAQFAQEMEGYWDRDSRLVAIATELLGFGLFEESEQVRQMIGEEPLQVLVLIQMADVHRQMGEEELAEEVLERAIGQVMALRCNVIPCPEVPRPQF